MEEKKNARQRIQRAEEEIFLPARGEIHTFFWEPSGEPDVSSVSVSSVGKVDASCVWSIFISK